ncbi:hypothetical protein C789_4877 [Microcystis aeruginosa FACHB-905 = DIANCHI905]|nr:hypothetical protein C789_4877 [Microcystis aeruginosa FACHB-905 = DIANCHI905]
MILNIAFSSCIAYLIISTRFFFSFHDSLVAKRVNYCQNQSDIKIEDKSKESVKLAEITDFFSIISLKS